MMEIHKHMFLWCGALENHYREHRPEDQMPKPREEYIYIYIDLGDCHREVRLLRDLIVLGSRDLVFVVVVGGWSRGWLLLVVGWFLLVSLGRFGAPAVRPAARPPVRPSWGRRRGGGGGDKGVTPGIGRG